MTGKAQYGWPLVYWVEQGRRGEAERGDAMLPNLAGDSGTRGQGSSLEENCRIFSFGEFYHDPFLEVLLSGLLEPPVHEREQRIILGYLGVFRSMSTVYIKLIRYHRVEHRTPVLWTLL